MTHYIERDSFTLPRWVGAWCSLPSLGPPHGRSLGTIAMSEEQTGMNNAFDEALEDFVEGRRARLPKNPGHWPHPYGRS